MKKDIKADVLEALRVSFKSVVSKLFEKYSKNI